MNKYLEKIAFALTTSTFKSSVTSPKIFNGAGRAITKKPVGSLLNPSKSVGAIKNNMGITQRIN